MKFATSPVLGAERIGLLAARFPAATLMALALVAIVAAFGMTKLRVDDALTDLFRSNSSEYRTYEQFSALFPTNELNIYVVARIDGPLSPAKLESLRDIHLDIGLLDGVSNVLSMFSVHRAAAAGPASEPVIPEELPEGKAFDRLTDLLSTSEQISGRFYARTTDTTSLVLLILYLEPDVIQQPGLASTVASLRSEMDALSEFYNTPLGLTGVPVMKAEIIKASRRDSRVFNIFGFVVGLLICGLFFRDWRWVLVSLLPTVLSVMCALGLIGFAGHRLNPIMNTIIPLVMIISIANALHLLFSIRRRCEIEGHIEDATTYAVKTVGPACLLSALTTAIAFASLSLAEAQLIRDFGLTAAAATALSFVLIMVSVPALSVLLLKSGNPRTTKTRLPSTADALDCYCRKLSRLVAARYRLLGFTGLVLLIVCSTLHLQLDARYRISDNVPQGVEATELSRLLDKHFGGLNAVHILVRHSEKTQTEGGERISAARDAHEVLNQMPGMNNVRSAADLPSAANKASPMSSIDDLSSELPQPLVRQFISADRQALLVTGNTNDVEAREVDRLRLTLDENLDSLRDRHPEFDFSVTGVATTTAQRALATITTLNQALILAIAVVLIVLVIFYRSFGVAFFSLIANLFAITATGACLYIFDIGLKYVSVVGLTVAFGLAVDDTVHFLSRYWLERSRGSTVEDAVRIAIERIGPVLILTTVIVVCGISATLTSSVPPTFTFGLMCMATLGFALIGDIIVLPSTILLFRGNRKQETMSQ